MSPERVFLGWDRPLLPRAVEWLWGSYPADGPGDGAVWNLSDVLVALPGARAGRRLLELLVDRAVEGKVALSPPRILTAGQLPEALGTPSPRAASELEEQLAWLRAVSESPGASVLFGSASSTTDSGFAARLALARDLAVLRFELGAERVAFEKVADACRDLGCPDEAGRWGVIAGMLHAVRAALAGVGRQDRVDAREATLLNSDPQPGGGGPVVLIGTTDLNILTGELLLAAAASGRPVLALVQAPESERDRFHPLGCLRPEAWVGEPIEIPNAQLRIVDRPPDQAAAVVDALVALPAGAYAPEEITVGMGDEDLAPVIERTLEMAGLQARPAMTRRLPQSRSAMLLAAVHDTLRDGGGLSCRHLAVLLRHPDLESWLAENLPAADPAGASAARDRWLPTLDRMMEASVPANVSALPATTDDPSDRSALVAVEAALERLLAPLRGPERTLPEWSREIAALLGAVYGVQSLARVTAEERQLLNALLALRTAVLDQAGVPDSLSPPMTAPQALAWTLDRLGDRPLPAEGERGAVELLGWLELPLDDAGVIVLTGVNEGLIPQSVTSDAFLPDRLRTRLGLLDNNRRLARDALSLRTLLESRGERLTVICGRRGPKGDPLLPSRLLFACDAAELLDRSLRFYVEGDPGTATRRPLLPAGDRCRFYLPRPAPLPTPITSLGVTEFSAYMQCPYRFYLRRVQELKGVDDNARELASNTVGTLLHDALAELASPEGRDLQDPAAIREFLLEALRRQALARVGDPRLPAVQLQLRQIEQRLGAFADWEARHRASGWRIRRVEADCRNVPFARDEPSFTLRGRIDRIDFNDSTGLWRLIDYKSGDAARSPSETHGVPKNGTMSPERWKDLQLPLYWRLAPDAGVPETALEKDQLGVGYVNIPRDPAQTGWSPSGWGVETRDSAFERARQVVRQVQAEKFWPPAEPPRYEDDLGGICFDRCTERKLLVSEGPERPVWGPIPR